jgi:hypothetical protein
MAGAGDGGCGLLVSRFKRRSFLVEGCLVVVATAKFTIQEAHACATSNKLIEYQPKGEGGEGLGRIGGLGGEVLPPSPILCAGRFCGTLRKCSCQANTSADIPAHMH